MEIEILFEECVYLESISWYNDNKYEMPFKVNGCNTLNRTYSGAEDFEGDSIGTVISGKYKPIYWLHVSIDDELVFFIDSETILDRNTWT